MQKPRGLGVLAVLVTLAGLSSGGCVSAEQHHAALADLQRLRVEAWQRSVEATALRLALDRAAAENAQLRAYGNQAMMPAVAALTARVDEMSKKQDALLEEVRSAPACAPATATSAQAGPQQQPPARKVTDLLYSRF